MSWLITMMMFVVLNGDGEITKAIPVMEVDRKEVENIGLCEEVAKANNKTAPTVYSTDGKTYLTPYQYCERSL